MKKTVVPTMILAILFLAACSIDAERFLEDKVGLEEAPEVTKTEECYSCIAKDGKELEICDNMDGTFSLSHNGESKSLEAPELEGHSAKKFVEIGCQLEHLEF